MKFNDFGARTCVSSTGALLLDKVKNKIQPQKIINVAHLSHARQSHDAYHMEPWIRSLKRGVDNKRVKHRFPPICWWLAEASSDLSSAPCGPDLDPRYEKNMSHSRMHACVHVRLYNRCAWDCHRDGTRAYTRTGARTCIHKHRASRVSLCVYVNTMRIHLALP
jgi:hypothetical protein